MKADASSPDARKNAIFDDSRKSKGCVTRSFTHFFRLEYGTKNAKIAETSSKENPHQSSLTFTRIIKKSTQKYDPLRAIEEIGSNRRGLLASTGVAKQAIPLILPAIAGVRAFRITLPP